jgi:hypothetical protein
VAVLLTKLKVTPAVEPPSVPAVEPLIASEPITNVPRPSPPESFKAAPVPVKEEAQPLPSPPLIRTGEGAKAVQAQVEAPKKIEEPRRVVTVEEPKKAAPAKAEEFSHDGASAHDPRPKPRPPAEAKKAASAKVEGELGARRPASLRAVPTLDDDVDPSSVSAEFFRKDEDSVPPIEEHEEHDAVRVAVLSPSALARRARLRRLVAGVVAFAGVISIAVVGKQVSASKRPASAAPPALATMGETPKPAVDPHKMAATEPAKAEANPKPADKVDDKRAEEPAKLEEPAKSARPDDAAKMEDVKKDEAVSAPSGADAATLKKETLSLLNRGRTKDAIAKAREAIAADGTDATSYLYLGSALQDSGKWKEGIEAYSDCVRNATKGPINECRAMGGHK